MGLITRRGNRASCQNELDEKLSKPYVCPEGRVFRQNIEITLAAADLADIAHV